MIPVALRRLAVGGLLIAGLFAAPLWAQNGMLPGQNTVTLAFERPGLPVPRYSLTVGDKGEGQYVGEETPPAVRGVDAPGPSHAFESKSFAVSPATVAQVFADAKDLHFFNTNCASNAKNIADTGKKTLTYQGAGGKGSCTYNYAENKKVRALTDIFQGIAATLDMGRELEHLHKYDRLGLDASMQRLAQEVTEGRALEVGSIAPTLQSIAADGELIQRVRAKANVLLGLSGESGQSSGAPGR